MKNSHVQPAFSTRLAASSAVYVRACPRSCFAEVVERGRRHGGDVRVEDRPHDRKRLARRLKARLLQPGVPGRLSRPACQPTDRAVTNTAPTVLTSVFGRMALFTRKSMSRIAALLASGVYQPPKREAETMNEILILGAGYTGMAATAGLVGRLKSRDDVHITLVNPQTRFTERLRLHQTASGQTLADLQIPDQLEGTGVDFVQGWVTGIDADAQTVRIDDAYTLRYDTLDLRAGQRRRHRDGAWRRRIRLHPEQRTGRDAARRPPGPPRRRHRRGGRRRADRRRVRGRDRRAASRTRCRPAEPSGARDR